MVACGTVCVTNHHVFHFFLSFQVELCTLKNLLLYLTYEHKTSRQLVKLNTVVCEKKKNYPKKCKTLFIQNFKKKYSLLHFTYKNI